MKHLVTHVVPVVSGNRWIVGCVAVELEGAGVVDRGSRSHPRPSATAAPAVLSIAIPAVNNRRLGRLPVCILFIDSLTRHSRN
jgi:hypothetical protein